MPTSMPTYGQVLRAPGVLPIFTSGALSAWGDHLTRITVAHVVYQRSDSVLAAAAAFAVSILPTVFGRSLLGPVADRVAYKHVLIAVDLLRAAIVSLLIYAVATGSGLWVLFGLLFLSQLVSGPAVAAQQMLWLDVLQDRRLYARAITLGNISEQANQVIGLVAGGLLLAVLKPEHALIFDVATFLIAVVVIARIAKVKPVAGNASSGVLGFFRDIGEGAAYLVRNRVLVSLLSLSLCAVWGMTAPEAVAVAYASQAGQSELGGLLMASPILGALVGLVVLGRWAPETQNDRMILLALLMPLPLFLTLAEPPPLVVGAAWFLSGALQAFMLPLQATFSLAVPDHIRGRVFGLAGAASVASTGIAFLVAGWLGDLTSPAVAVAILAGVSVVAVAVLYASWPRTQLQAAVREAYDG